MDAKDRLFADIAMRLQLLTRDQVAACSERVPGKRFAEAAVELGLISSDEAALVTLQAERALGRQQQRVAGAGVRIEEERVQRVDPRAEPPAPAPVAAARPRKRGARAWESPDAVEHGQIHVPRTAPPATVSARPLAQPTANGPATAPMPEPAGTAAMPDDDPPLTRGPAAHRAPANGDFDGFPLAQGDEIARVEPSEPAPPPPPPPRQPTAEVVARPAPPPPARPASGTMRQVQVAAQASQEAPEQATAQPARARVPTPPQPRPAIPTPAPPKAAERRPGAALAPKDSYLGKALALAIRHHASDLHVHSGAPLLIRVDGELRPLSGTTPLTPEAAEKIIAEITTDVHWAQLSHKGEVDFACEIPGLGRFRANVYRQQRGLDAVFRIIALRPPSLEQLGLPARLSRLTDFRTGMVLCTGPAGCGKSTTLAALLDGLVQTRSDHILTIEDPVEYVFPDGRALVNQRQIGDHTSSFSRALRAALREDPDIIAITELRDRETISLAISAAETGHLVLGTLHTGNAAQTIHRMVSSFPADEQEQVRVMLAESLRAVVSQRLVPMAAGRGRVPAIELLMVTTAVSNLIREDKTHQLPSVMQTGKAAGMLTLDDSLAELLSAGIITADAARRVAVKKDRFA